MDKEFHMHQLIKNIALVAAVVLFSLYLPGCLIRGNGANNPDDEGSPLVDTDKDGTPNVSDSDIDGDGTPNTSDNDIDGDGIPNTSDSDIDGDGIANIDDNDIDGDGIINGNDRDIDGDGRINTQDDDIDGDGVANIDDNDIDGDGIINTEDEDLDGDGILNEYDFDIDNDGITNDKDNDIDGDGIANTDDDDIDGDGVANADDTIPGGTGDRIAGTEGTVNSGTDSDTGTANTGTDTDTGNTDDDDYVSGIGIVAVDTVGYTLSIPDQSATGTVTTRENVNLGQVRDEIERNDIALSTFDLTGLNVIASGSNGFIETNSDKKIVVTVSYIDENDNTIPVLQSAATNGRGAKVATVGDLATGLQLNDEIFAASAGYNSFISLIKDESVPDVQTIIEIEFLDAPQGGDDLNVNFILRASGKKPL